MVSAPIYTAGWGDPQRFAVECKCPALASLNMSVQNMSSEMHRLKDQIRPVLKKKEVSILMQAHAGIS
jgi:hypothetical protein